jgi:mono/diheme cytochrome c family protein
MRRRTRTIAIHVRDWYFVINARHVQLLMGVTLAIFLIAFATAMARASASNVSNDQTKERTTRDKVYSKEQATRGAAMFGKVCAACHDPEKKTADKTPGPALVGAKSLFVENWKDHKIGEIFTTILTTMPNDGSVVLSEADTVDAASQRLSGRSGRAEVRRCGEGNQGDTRQVI